MIYIKFAIRNIFNNVFINILMASALAFSFFLINAIMVYNDNSRMELDMVENISQDRAIYYKSRPNSIFEDMNGIMLNEEAYYLKDIAEVNFVMDFYDRDDTNINIKGISDYLYYNIKPILQQGNVSRIDDEEYLPGIAFYNTNKAIGDIVTFRFGEEQYRIKITGIMDINSPVVSMTGGGSSMQIRHLISNKYTFNNATIIFPMDDVIGEDYTMSHSGLYIKFTEAISDNEIEAIVSNLKHYGSCETIKNMINNSEAERKEYIMMIMPFIILVLMLILFINFVYVMFVYYKDIKAFSILLIQGARRRDIFIINVLSNLFSVALSLILFIIIELRVSNPFVYTGMYVTNSYRISISILGYSIFIIMSGLINYCLVKSDSLIKLYRKGI